MNKVINDIEVIGIDHGFKNMKTVNHIFPTAISKLVKSTEDKRDILEFDDGSVFTIAGERVSAVENHDKADSEEFYNLTLVALAKELNTRGKTKARVIMTVGLPLKWYMAQQETFKNKLLSKKELSYKFEGKRYTVTLEGVKVYIQGVSAIVDKMKKYNSGKVIIVDIGGETMDIIPLQDGKPLFQECKISTEASIHCITEIKERIESEFYSTIDEDEIINVIVKGKQKTKDAYINLIQEELESYSSKVFRKLKEFRINIDRTHLVFVGGGSHIIKNFGAYDTYNISFILDIQANARGYELTEKYIQLAKKGK